MVSNSTAQLEVPAQPLTLPHAYGPHSMTFLHRGQTQAQVVHALYKTMYAPITPGNRIYLLASEAWFILTVAICSVMLLKRRREKLWIVTTKYCAYGSLYVANAVICLIIAVTSYMFAWNLGAIVLAIFSYAHMSILEWFWIVPAPWWTLVIFAYISIHGFVLGCSPRSPLSSLGANRTIADRNTCNQLSVTTWKMRFLAVGYVLALIGCIPAFGFLPLYMVASGLNLIRCHVPIDVTVIKRKDKVEERDPAQPTVAFEAQDDDDEDIERNHHDIKMKPSTGTFKSAKSRYSEGDDSHEMVNQVNHLPTQDIEAKSGSADTLKPGLL
ncbi:hypothetical protein NDA16_002793 [Ustilago loliicola]|nr:hypothetical protein NDA16_002793 [Ustilago loliicola]